MVTIYEHVRNGIKPIYTFYLVYVGVHLCGYWFGDKFGQNSEINF